MAKTREKGVCPLFFQDVMTTTVRRFIEMIPMNVPEYEVEMFCWGLLNHWTYFLGAAKFQASMINLNPNSIQYLNWVKDMTLYLFLPRLKMMAKRVDSSAGQ